MSAEMEFVVGGKRFGLPTEIVFISDSHEAVEIVSKLFSLLVVHF